MQERGLICVNHDLILMQREGGRRVQAAAAPSLEAADTCGSLAKGCHPQHSLSAGLSPSSCHTGVTRHS